MVLVCLILLPSIMLSSKRKYGQNINPITLFIGMNLFSLILMFATSSIDSHLNYVVWEYIAIMFIAFALGAKAGEHKLLFRGKEIVITKQTNIIRLKKVIIIYSIVFDIAAFYYLHVLNTSFGFSNLLTDMSGLNQLVQSGEFETGLYTYFTPIGVPLSILILFYLNNEVTRYKALLIIQYILCFIPCISPRRDTLYFMLTMTIFFILTKNNSFYKVSENVSKRIKRIFIVVVLIILGLWVMSYTQGLMNKSSIKQATYLFGIRIPSWLQDPILYLAGNYPCLEKIYETGALKFQFPLISTFRLLYRYIFSLWGIKIDTTTAFALGFYNIGNISGVRFNTVPMLYYSIIESGFLFFLFFFIVGVLSEKAYKGVKKYNSIGSIMLGLFQYDIIFFSFRSYNLIFLSYFMAFVYIIIAKYFVDVDSLDLAEVAE